MFGTAFCRGFCVFRWAVLGFWVRFWVSIKRNPFIRNGVFVAVSVFSLSGARLWVRLLGVNKKKSPLFGTACFVAVSVFR